MAGDVENPIDMVLVMGITGAGKSYFINKLKDGAVVEGDSLESSKCRGESVRPNFTH